MAMNGIARALAGVVVMTWVTAITGGPDPASAIGFCDCCASDLNASCQAACAGETKTPGQCTAVVDYAGKGATDDDRDPLTGISLKDLSLGNPTRAQLESLRRFLEAGRRRAIQDYNRAAWRLQHGRITQDAFDAVNALYKEAMVNYYHGIRAYLVRIGAKSD
jgi:hypothetical protein